VCYSFAGCDGKHAQCGDMGDVCASVGGGGAGTCTKAKPPTLGVDVSVDTVCHVSIVQQHGHVSIVQLCVTCQWCNCVSRVNGAATRACD